MEALQDSAMGPWCHTSGTTRQLCTSRHIPLSGIPVLLVSGGTKAQEGVQTAERTGVD